METTMPIELLPVGLFLLGALIAGFSNQRLAAVVALLIPVISALAALSILAPGASASWSIMAYELEVVRADRFNLVLVGLFHLAAFIAAIYALDVRDRLQHAALMVYIAGGIGAVLAGDLISLFVFFELIAIGGTLLIMAGRTEASLRAGVRYLVFQVAAGVTLLAGILTYSAGTGDWQFGHIGLDQPGGWLILLAFGIKSGFPLLHNWIMDAYPKASLTGQAVLVAVTTKVGIYGLGRSFSGEEILVVIGTVMALWPLFFALVENDLRRVLAYTMMVQLGIMVVAAGIGSDLAIDGIAMHIVMDVLFKMTLFMALGVLVYRLGTTRADQLGGLWRAMPLTTACVVVAIAANAAVPLTGGFLSKKLLMGAIQYSDYSYALWLVLLSLSGLSMLYLGLRILWEGFLKPARNARQGIKDAPWPMAVAMLIPVTLLLLAGLLPGLTEFMRPAGSDYWPLTPVKIIGHLQMLLFAILVYVLLDRYQLGLPRSRPTGWLDIEWLYRRALPALAVTVRDFLADLRDDLSGLIRRCFTTAPGDGRLSTTLGRTWPTGSMALWVAILLVALLLFGIR
jgi:multicomponent Na+:H+ antiporter subunit D